jgi:hypothetical protein
MLRSYDDWRCTPPEDDGPYYEPTPCPVCTGDPDAEPCGEDCAETMEAVRRARVIRGNYEAARRALHLAKVFSMEGGPHDARIPPCLEQVGHFRAYIATLRRAS